MNDALADIADLVFTIVIGCMGTLEFLYVVRHLYHWSFRHADMENGSSDSASLAQLQDEMRAQLAVARAREQIAGTSVMQDGVPYKDGFRVDQQEADIEQLKTQHAKIDMKVQRQQELEAELARQRNIEEMTRKQLEAAEAALAAQRKRQAEEEKEKEKEKEEEAANSRKLLETERAREAEQRELEEEKRKVEEEQRKAEENARNLLALERQREEELRHKEEEEQRQREEKENAARREQEEKRKKEEEDKERERQHAEEQRIILEAEHHSLQEKSQLKDNEQQVHEVDAESALDGDAVEQSALEVDEEALDSFEASENIRKLIEAEILEEERQRQLEEAEDNDNDNYDYGNENDEEDEGEGESESEKLWNQQSGNNVAAERERQRENKQKLIEENARKFLEAEREMVELQQRMLEAAHKSETDAGNESQALQVVEKPAMEGGNLDEYNEPPTQTLKTQFGQTSSEPYSVSTKPLLFPGVSDDGSSIEPNSMQSSFNTQPSEEIITGAEENSKTINLQFSQQTERQDPDGEDNVPAMQYTDDYLRSLDGIRQRPLVREDGSGRRRAFKKRRSSGSSNSSRESRASREEEVRMFTSLEEEEFQSAEKGDSDFTPIKYTEQKLKVKGHHRRHKRSPAKDAKTGDESLRSSLEMLGEESTNPWGELVPEHYKDTAFWKREKAMSIDEEEIDLDRSAASQKAGDGAADLNKPKTSSFEEATEAQNEEAISALQKQQSQETREKDVAQTADTNKASNDNKKNT